MLRKLASKSFVFLPNVLYALGLVWILLFPAVNITTGEPKPRGMYVDEHALLVQSQLFRNPDVPLFDTVTYRNDNSSTCMMLHGRNIVCRQITVARSPLTEIVVTPVTSKLIHEATVLVLRYDMNDKCSMQTSLRVVDSIAQHLQQVQWMARNLVIVLLPSTGSESAASSAPSDLDDWLPAHHRPSISHLVHSAADQLNGRAGSDFGLMREAYVMDLTAKATSCGDTGALYSSLTLRHEGSNGLLPNMDMVAYPLALHSDVLHTQSGACAAALTNQVASGLQQLQSQYSTDTSLRSIVSFLSSAWAEIESSPSMRGYRDRLLGLVCSMYAHISGDSTGLHARFLDYNIDSITVKAERVDDKGVGNSIAGQSKQLQRGKRQRERERGRSPPAGVSLQKLVEVALSFVYISNNLQEELHHSHFYYLLMGREHFVGIVEYGFVAGLFLLSLFLLFHQVCARVDCTRLHTDIATVLLALLPIVLCGGWMIGLCDSERQGGLAGPAVDRWLSGHAASPAIGALCAYLAGLLCIVAVTVSSPSGKEIDETSSTTLTQDANGSVAQEGSSRAVWSPEASVLSAAGRLAMLLMLVLVALSWTFAQNFSLGAALALTIIPTLVTGTYQVLHGQNQHGGRGWGRGLRAVVLAALAVLHSPLGLTVAGQAAAALLHREEVLLRAYTRAGSMTNSAVMVLNAAASYYAALCLLAGRQTATE